MSLVAKGADELRVRAERDAEREKHRAASDRKHCVNRFRMDFCKDSYIMERVPSFDPTNPTGLRPTGKYIEDPDNPFPEIAFLEGDGGYREATLIQVDDGLGDKLLVFRVTWKYEGGWDRAYWDDGWWPKWELRVPRRLRRPRWVKVYGAAAVAAALRKS